MWPDVRGQNHYVHFWSGLFHGCGLALSSLTGNLTAEEYLDMLDITPQLVL